MELSSQAYSQVETSKTLQISELTISRGIDYLRSQSKDKVRKYLDETLPEEYDKCLVGITSILKEAWTTSQNTENKREKIHALSLVKECYSMKLKLLTNATVIDDAMKFILDYSKNNPASKEENSEEESKEEPDYDEDTELKEEQEKETGEITTTETTTTKINRVF